MATSYTSLLGFALPVTGELDGTWGDVVNNSITQLVEDSVAGVATTSVAAGDWTLTTTGSGASNQARCAILIPTGSPGVSRNIIAPSKSKAYIVINQSDAPVVVKGSATTGTTIPTGGKSVVAWNGSDFIQIGDVTLAGNNAFTGANTFYNSTGQTFGTGTAAQDGIILTGRAGGTNTYRVTFTPATLTGNQTITFPNATGTVGLLGTAQTWTAVQTLTDPALIGTVTEDVYTIVDGAAFEVDPGNGSVQLITLGASRTPKATNFAAGEAITLMVDDGSAYTITWTDATWGGSGVVWMTDSGTAPTLATTGYTTIVLWKVGTQVYGARVGNNA